MRRLAFTLSLLAVFTLNLVAQIPASKHVYIVAEENRSYEHIVGSPDMPYLNSLFSKGTLFTQFYANAHNSITEYFYVTSGVVPTTDNDTTATYDVDNIIRHAMQLGLTYKGYAQTLPYAGYAGIYYGAYLKRHTALPYYSDMGNSQSEMLKLVPSDQLAADIQNGTLPNFAFITPDGRHDLHDCPTTLADCEQLADQFLKSTLAPLLARPEFQPGGDGVLIIWADEADLSTDKRCASTVMSGCGGRIAVAAIGPRIKAGYQSPVTYHHENVLKTMLMALGEKQTFPGLSQNAQPMSDMYIGNPNGIPSPQPAPLSVSVQSPTANQQVSTHLHVVASSSGPGGVEAMQIYVDGVKKFAASGATVDTYLDVTPGAHKVTVKAWDPSGGSLSKTLAVTAVALTVSITSPAQNYTTTSPLKVEATAAGQNISAMQLYIDGALKYTVKGNTLSTPLAVSLGTHSVTAKVWDVDGQNTVARQLVNIVAPNGVAIQSPLPNTTVSSSFTVAASGYDTTPITAIQIYADGILKSSSSSSSITKTLTLPTGAHYLTVKIWDSAGNTYKKSETIKVK